MQTGLNSSTSQSLISPTTENIKKPGLSFNMPLYPGFYWSNPASISRFLKTRIRCKHLLVLNGFSTISLQSLVGVLSSFREKVIKQWYWFKSLLWADPSNQNPSSFLI